MTFLNRTLTLFFILFLFCCWGCGDPPNSVMEMVLPDKDMPAAEPPAVTMADVKTTPADEETAAEEQPPAEEPPVTMEEEEEEEPPPPPVETELPDLSLALEMDAIMASEGQVHSPIPDDVYEQLWGNWTKAGSLAPRKFYKKFIDADGIAIVGSENVDNMFFQMARHIVLVMTSKVPGLREALSADQIGGIGGDDAPFRLVLTNRDKRDVINMPENLGLKSDDWFAIILGTFDGSLARADVYFWGNNENLSGHKTIMHEMAHAIESAIYARNLVPNFYERLGTAWELEEERIELRREVDGDPYLGISKEDALRWPDRPMYCMANGNSHDGASEFWAQYVSLDWFDFTFRPNRRDPNYNPLENRRERCPNLIGITEEVFPKFSLHFAVETHGYETEDGRIIRHYW